MNIANLLAKSRTRSTSSTQSFHDIDIDGTALNLRVRERAAEAARLGLPAFDSANLDATECSIVAEIEAEAKSSLSTYLEDQKCTPSEPMRQNWGFS